MNLFRIRNVIWAFCLKINDNVVVSITERSSFHCSGPKKIAPNLLQVNRKVYTETKPILYGVNNFHIALNEESCMRIIEKPTGEILESTPAIPSLWNSVFRQKIYLIRHFLITITLNAERAEPALIGLAARQRLFKIKAEYASVVESAVQELCNVLSLSASIKSVYINFEGRSQIKNGREHNLMRPLTMLRGLKEVHAEGVPRYFAYYLGTSMERA